MKYLNYLLVAALMFIAAACNNKPVNNGNPELAGKADKIVYGNIITMDEQNMRVEAMTFKNGLVQFVGSKEEAEKHCDANTVREDYGTATVYPGFIDVHTHPVLAGQRLSEQIDLVDGNTIDDYIETIRAFVEAHPDKSIYRGAGWGPRNRELTAADIDAVCSDKMVILNSIDGHSYWLNSKALEHYHVDAQAAAEDGPARIHVDAAGNPTGVIVEENERMAKYSVYDVNEMKEQLLTWQDFAFKIGYTAVGDAGFGCVEGAQAYSQLDNEGKLKLYTYASYYEPIPEQDVDEKIAHAEEVREQYSGTHITYPGIKMFIDGVIEGHTAWTIDDYCDQPGYTGVKKESDHDYMTRLVKTANEHGFYVHMHTIGDGAVKFAVDAIEDAQQQSGITDMRNCLAHLQLVRPEDVQRIADNKIVAIVAPLWTPYDTVVTPREIAYIGKERVANAYPIKSFVDAGATIAFHSDYPVSTDVNIPESILKAELRSYKNGLARQVEKEGISRMEALKAMTVNCAYALGDSRIGSLEVGKIANYTVFDVDFLKDSEDELWNASLVATGVDGEVVYKK